MSKVRAVGEKSPNWTETKRLSLPYGPQPAEMRFIRDSVAAAAADPLFNSSGCAAVSSAVAFLCFGPV